MRESPEETARASIWARRDAVSEIADWEWGRVVEFVWRWLKRRERARQTADQWYAGRVDD